jgi:LCP family protein required for cell wall assembly
VSSSRSRNERRPVPPGGEPYTDETVVMRRQRPPASAQQRPARARGGFWRRLRLALLLALAAAFVGAGLLYWQVSSLAAAITVADVRNNPPIASPLLGANVLVIGVDERADHPEEGVRGDTLLLARLDAAGRWASLLSIPRDTQVEIPGVGITKINVAYGQGFARAQELYGPSATPQQGGMALGAETVEQFLQLRQRGQSVDFVATVNFDGFASLIDALGGITVNVPAYILDEEYPTEDFGIMRVEFQPGPQRMDGATALIYARTRHADSDFGRAERQQQVVRAILTEFQSKGWLGRALAMPGLLRAIGGEEGARPIVTTMPIDRIDVLFGLLGLAGSVNPDSMGQFRLGPDELAYEEGSNLVWDEAAVQALVDKWQRPPSEAAENATVQVFNGTETTGLARGVALDLEQAGFRVLVPDNAPALYERTTVYDRTGNPATSRRVARTLGAEVVSGAPPDGIFSEADIVVVLGANAAGQ